MENNNDHAGKPLYRAYYAPSPFLVTMLLYYMCHLNLNNNPVKWGHYGYYHPHFTNEGIEPQKGWAQGPQGDIV